VGARDACLAYLRGVRNICAAHAADAHAQRIVKIARVAVNRLMDELAGQRCVRHQYVDC
jgi:hypothetical protein